MWRQEIKKQAVLLVARNPTCFEALSGFTELGADDNVFSTLCSRASLRTQIHY